MKILRPTLLVLILFACLVPAPLSNSSAAEDRARIVILAVEDPTNEQLRRGDSMRDYADRELRPLGHHVNLLEGNQALPTNFPGMVAAVPGSLLAILSG